MSKFFLLLVLCLSSAWGVVSGGVQGGLASPNENDLGFYAGGHLDPLDIVPNLLLHLPAEVMMAGHFTDISAGAQVRYCFTGKIGFFAGGGLRVHFWQPDNASGNGHSGLGMDIVGGYTFDATGCRISPELTFMAFEVDSINLGCGFTF